MKATTFSRAERIITILFGAGALIAASVEWGALSAVAEWLS